MLGGLDIVLFFLFLGGVMLVGLMSGRHESSSEDYFLAGRKIPWWGVAGSIFGTNVSANHLVGMLGVGFSIGFAQSHYELGAIAAILVLCYFFLPVYRRLGIFTLSEYLGRRFGDSSRLLYTLILVVLIVVQMTAAFYIGSRSLGLLLADTPLELGYLGGVAVLVIITTAYTIFGGLTAVVWTDVMQSLLLLVAGVLVAVLTFAQPEVGGFAAMMARDAALPAAEQKMHLYLPSSHPDLPWTGALTGLIALHVFFWSTNQYLVQRALAAKSLTQARVGALTGGFLKLLIPLFSVAGGVAAAQLFAARSVSAAPDEAFPVLVNLVIPAGYGLIGIISAGLIGAIISSIDSMMNSAATLVTVDIYKHRLRPAADDASMVRVGRWVIVAIVGLSTLLAITSYDPDSRDNFFLVVSRQSSYFTPGLIAAFVLGMFYRRANGVGAVLAIACAPVLSLVFELAYDGWLHVYFDELLGARLNFMHRVFLTLLASLAVLVVGSRVRPADPERARYLWVEAAGEQPAPLAAVVGKLGLFALIQAALAGLLVTGALPPALLAALSAVLTAALFAWHIARYRRPEGLLRDDRVLAAALSSATMFMMFAFY
ncbi:SLC5 family protein [Haliangium ochraceum]|uniref:SSS sodium solute transporter superfamily n=1 Tax=Haliangium ochraceum (strain DSM 14365 / JCM 11303 / SMP-2) TaxID=502025 RepID=D0LK43_HALO1|nr:sodium/solute symporter [Haliangium ochraceum]ACY13077.1 SSS sodium solute transporter superfamily [Haliangium ochraceum DSM 14365]